MNDKIEVRIYPKYGGGVKVNAIIGNITYVIEYDYICEFLENLIEEKGYTTEIKVRQQYPRLIINK